MVAHFLIVEDQVDIHQLIVESVRSAGFQSTSAYSGSEARLLLEKQTFDLMILDLMLPGLSGEDLIRDLRQTSNLPILVISAKDSVQSKVEVLGMGADDYLVKPFDLKELLARIQVQLKRKSHAPTMASGQQTIRGLTQDPSNHTFSYGGAYLKLTPIESRILDLLFQSPHRIFSKQEIYEYAWQQDYYGEDQTLNVHISNLRKKLQAQSDQNWIQTIWGIGFRLLDDSH